MVHQIAGKFTSGIIKILSAREDYYATGWIPFFASVYGRKLVRLKTDPVLKSLGQIPELIHYFHICLLAYPWKRIGASDLENYNSLCPRKKP